MSSCLCSHCFANLAVDTKMKIFMYLKDNGQQTVSKIVQQTILSQPTVSYHLKTMEADGLLSKKRMGKKIYYQVNENCPHHEKLCLLKQMNFSN